MAKRSYFWLLVSLAVFGFVADQASKYVVFRWLYNGGLGDRYDVAPGVFEFIAQFSDPRDEDAPRPNIDGAIATWGGEAPPRVNQGALFGLGNQKGGTANSIFAGVSVLAAIAILIWGSRKFARHDAWLSVTLGLILAGTLGNLYDRVVFNGVRDFLHFYWFEWPVFNVADCFLVVGACMLLLQAMRPTPEEKAAAEADAAKAAT